MEDVRSAGKDAKQTLQRFNKCEHGKNPGGNIAVFLTNILQQTQRHSKANRETTKDAHPVAIVAALTTGRLLEAAQCNGSRTRFAARQWEPLQLLKGAAKRQGAAGLPHLPTGADTCILGIYTVLQQILVSHVFLNNDQQ